MAATFADWLRDHPPPEGAFRQTLADVARRTLAGEDFMHDVRELLDEFALCATSAQRAAALAQAPAPLTDRRLDAYLGALAEHLARRSSLPCPAWANEDSRFLDRMWFVSPTPGFRAIALRESPVAFRRRGIFIARGMLERV